MRASRFVVVGLVTSLVALGVTLSGGRSAARAAPPCFGGPAIGPVCGTLTESEPPQPRGRPDSRPEGRAGARPGRDDRPAVRLRQHRSADRVPRDQSRRHRRARVAGCVGQAGVNNGVKSLGIPPLRQTDGPAGVRLSHQETALPAPVGLTATFDRAAADDYGVVIGREGRATNQDVLYAPMINQVAFLDRRPQLRDARRGPVPGRRARRRRDAGRPGRGPDRDAQAHGAERLRELAHEHSDQARRAHAPRARAAGVREGRSRRATPARSCAPTAASASRTRASTRTRAATTCC